MLAGALVRAGDLALGLAPVVLFFSATTELGGLLAAMMLLGVALVAQVGCVTGLWRAATDGEGWRSSSTSLRAGAWVGAWALTSSLIFGRLAVDVALFILT